MMSDDADFADDGPSLAALEKQARAETGIEEEDEDVDAAEAEVEVEAEPIQAATAQPSGQIGRDVAASRLQGIDREVMTVGKQLFEQGKIDGMPLGEYLGLIGCDDLAPGKCKLWYKGDGGSGGRWLYATAPAPKGPRKPGYPMTLAMGDDNNERVTVLVCSLLKSQDRDGTKIVFDKCNRIDMNGDKVVAAGALNEQELIGVLRDEDFGINPFDFEAV